MQHQSAPQCQKRTVSNSTSCLTWAAPGLKPPAMRQRLRGPWPPCVLRVPSPSPSHCMSHVEQMALSGQPHIKTEITYIFTPEPVSYTLCSLILLKLKRHKTNPLNLLRDYLRSDLTFQFYEHTTMCSIMFFLNRQDNNLNCNIYRFYTKAQKTTNFTDKAFNKVFDPFS